MLVKFQGMEGKSAFWFTPNKLLSNELYVVSRPSSKTSQHQSELVQKRWLVHFWFWLVPLWPVTFGLAGNLLWWKFFIRYLHEHFYCHVLFWFQIWLLLQGYLSLFFQRPHITQNWLVVFVMTNSIQSGWSHLGWLVKWSFLTGWSQKPFV